MRPFCKNYLVKTEEINLDILEVKKIEEVKNCEFHIFNINSLGFFNRVIANFENNKQKNNEYLKLKIELPKQSLYLQLIPLTLFIIIITLAIIDKKKSDINTVIILAFSVAFIYYIYKKEFSKKTKSFLNKLIEKQNNC